MYGNNLLKSLFQKMGENKIYMVEYPTTYKLSIKNNNEKVGS